MEAAKEEEEESSAKNANENVNQSSKLPLLQWRKSKSNWKKGKGHNKETLLANFEIEAMKFNQKTNEHAQRKGQEPSKAVSVSSSQVGL